MHLYQIILLNLIKAKITYTFYSSREISQHRDLSLGRSVTVILESERCAQCPPLGRRLFRDAFQVLQAPHVSLSHCGDCLSIY